MAQAMDAKTCYDQVSGEIAAVRDSDVVGIAMSNEDAVAEARRVEQLTIDDRDRLVQSRVTGDDLDKFRVLVGAAAYAAAQIDALLDTQVHARDVWSEAKPRGAEVRKELFAVFDYALSPDPAAMERLDNIKRGQGDADMVLDLLALNILGNQQRPALDAAKADIGLVDSAKDLHEELSAALARTMIDPERLSEARRTFRKAWTLLSKPLNEVYSAGRYVFRNEPDRCDLYMSDYYKKLGKLSAKARAADSDKPEPTPTPAPAPVPATSAAAVA